VVVVGAARSGIAAAQLAARQGARVTLTETRDTFDAADRLRAEGIELELGGHKAATLASADVIVTSPGVPTSSRSSTRRGREAWRRSASSICLAVGDGTRDCHHRNKRKSTTTTLIGRMLDAAGKTVMVAATSARR